MCRLKESDLVLVMRIFDKTELTEAQHMLLANEASILRQLHHPNIVEIVCEQETDTRLCQVFELTVVSQSVSQHPLCSPFDAHCCHMGTAIKQPVPDRVKQPSFVIFDIRTFCRSVVSVRVPGCQKFQMTA